MVDGAAVGGLNPVSAFALVGALGVNAHRRSPDRLGVLAGRVPLPHCIEIEGQFLQSTRKNTRSTDGLGVILGLLRRCHKKAVTMTATHLLSKCPQCDFAP